jgi:hypothetical protein
MAHSAGTGDLILKQSTPLRSTRPRGDSCKPMNGTTGSQSLVIEASRMKGEENWAVATKGTKEASHHWPALTQQHTSSFRFRIMTLQLVRIAAAAVDQPAAASAAAANHSAA